MGFEQVISIMPNPRARRGSIASAAFPELHHQNRAKEPDTLLLLTRTHTDPRGRRHSVAVPLIPPPYGEKFEGGYHIERNPITGATRQLGKQEEVQEVLPCGRSRRVQKHLKRKRPQSGSLGGAAAQRICRTLKRIGLLPICTRHPTRQLGKQHSGVKPEQGYGKSEGV